MQRLSNLIERCQEAMKDAICKKCEDCGVDGFTSVDATVDTKDGIINLWMDKYDNTVVWVEHNNGYDNPCPLLRQTIDESLPDWDETVEQWQKDNPCEDEWTSHGFLSEADYVQYRYG